MKIIPIAVICFLILAGCMTNGEKEMDTSRYEDLIDKSIAVILENTSGGESRLLFGEVKKEMDGYVFINNRKTIKLTFDDDKLKRTKKVNQEMKTTIENLKNCDYVLWLYMEEIDEATPDMKKVGSLK